MYNFDFKPDCPDGDNAMEIAHKILSAKDVQENPLEFLLKKHLDTKDLFKVGLESINDFVRLQPNDICQKITLGTFQVRLSKSYIGDLIKYGTAFLVSEDFMKKEVRKKLGKNSNGDQSKIVAVEIISRHKRSQKTLERDSKSKAFKTVYKVFVQYVPNGKDAESIKSNI